MKLVVKKIMQGALVVPALVLGLSFAVATPASAACEPGSMTLSNGVDCAQGANQPTDLVGDGGIFSRIVDIMLFIVGAVAVIMLIVGGIRYVTSAGDQASVTAAKNTIMYAIIGIVVAILAYSVVHFVVGSLMPK